MVAIKEETLEAVVEGSHADAWNQLTLKTLSISVPVDATVIAQEGKVYHLIDRASLNPLQTEKHVHTLPSDLLSLLPGRTFGVEGCWVVDVRSIFLNDGRVYVEDSMLKDERYKRALPRMIHDVENYFKGVPFSFP